MGCHRSLLHPRFWEASSSREEADRHREGVHGAEQLVFHVRLSGRPEPHPSPATQKDLGCKYTPPPLYHDSCAIFKLYSYCRCRPSHRPRERHSRTWRSFVIRRKT